MKTERRALAFIIFIVWVLATLRSECLADAQTVLRARATPARLNHAPAIAALTPLDAGAARAGEAFYLYPHNLHLVAGTTSSTRLVVIDHSDHVVAGNVTFYGYDPTLISISTDGYVTALRTEGDDEIGTWVSAAINDVNVSSTTVVRVLSASHPNPFFRPVGENTVLYYPTNVNGEDLSSYVTLHQVPTVNEYAYSIQYQLMGVRPFGGARQIFEIDFGETDAQTVCGISGNPIRLGWHINGNEWQNCFLVPHIPPRSPQWNVMYHELGHNFTWASWTFGRGLGRFEYSEGVATAISAATTQAILNNPTIYYPVGADAKASLRQQLDSLNTGMSNNFQNWLSNGADFSQLDPDLVDGIWLSYNSQRPDDFAPRFFLPLQPRYSSQLSGILNNLSEDDQHTLYAALTSAAMGQDLSATFSVTYHYPVDPTLFGSAYPAFRNILRTAFPASWTRVFQQPGMASRAMRVAYDAHRRQVVMFGGLSDHVLSATLEYDGTTWHQVNSLHTPPPRAWHGMTYDPVRQVVVLFGGQQDGPRLNDTWEYNGDDWAQVSTLDRPSPREGFGMVYDSCRNKTVLFGGATDSGLSVETWEYDGVGWHRITAPDSPPGRNAPAMAFDSRRCRAILFGGGTVSWSGLNDLWEYDGVTWSQRSLNPSPAPRWAHAMAFDAARGKTVLFGGYGFAWPEGRQLGDTWEYDGQAWTPAHPEQAPRAREQHAMTYDTDQKCVIMFGGVVLNLGLDGDTWELYDRRVYLPLVMRGS